MTCKYCNRELFGDDVMLRRCAFGRDLACRDLMLARVKVLEAVCKPIVHELECSAPRIGNSAYPIYVSQSDKDAFLAVLSPKEQGNG